MSRPSIRFKSLTPVLGFCALAIISNAYASQLDDDSPLSPTAITPEIRYRSAFDDYAVFQNEEIASWRDLNEQVKGGGHSGHGGHSMQGMQPEKMKMQPENSIDGANPHQHHEMK